MNTSNPGWGETSKFGLQEIATDEHRERYWAIDAATRPPAPSSHVLLDPLARVMHMAVPSLHQTELTRHTMNAPTETVAMPFDWQFPYPSQRMPVLARNIVATSQPLAAQAGLSMMLKGGNAVDAILATAIALTVMEPTSNGIGSDAFAILWDGNKLHGLNASGRSPAAWTPQRFAGLKEMPRRGWDSVTVPGRSFGLARAVGKVRQAAVRRSVRAGDPLRARRLHGLADHRATVGAADQRIEIATRVRAGIHAERPRAVSRREIRIPRPGEDARSDRKDQGRRVLPRRAGRQDRRAFDSERRRHDAR